MNVSKIVADSATDEIAALKAKIAAMESAAIVAADRAARKPGWYEKTVKPLSAKAKPGAKAGRFSAVRMLAGGIEISHYVGGNGKLCTGGHYGTYGVTAWEDEADTIKAYFAGTGPDCYSADLDRIEATGHWSRKSDLPSAE